MGGSGSGRWGTVWTKSTVEDGLTIDLNKIRKEGFLKYYSGNITWSRNDVQTASIGYELARQSDKDSIMKITLQYKVNDEPVELPIVLQGSPQKLGGIRYRFICPLVRDGTPCKRRCEKLHLPPRARYFGCRKCYDLTYKSCQQNHIFDRIYRGISLDTNIPIHWVKFVLDKRNWWLLEN